LSNQCNTFINQPSGAQMKKSINTAAQSVTFSFDGDLPSITLSMSKVSPDNATYAMLHGFSQRCGDNAAIARKDKDGNVITVTEAMRRDAILEMVTHYESGSTDWNVKGGTRAAPQNPVILAIAAKRGCSYAEAEAFLAEQFLGELSA